MPGIVGLVTKMPAEQANRELQRMVESIRHESSYLTGTWCDESLGVYIGWTSRSGCFSEEMPIRSRRGNVTMIFSGEDYHDPKTAGPLNGHEPGIEPSGAAHLARLYEEDASFPSSLNGRFHGLVADTPRGEVMLFNDRYGMHRVYYHESK